MTFIFHPNFPKYVCLLRIFHPYSFSLGWVGGGYLLTTTVESPKDLVHVPRCVQDMKAEKKESYLTVDGNASATGVIVDC